LSDALDVSAWSALIREHWIKNHPSGEIFRSKDVFSWVEEGGVQLSPADLKPINAAGRQIWRHRLSRAMRRLADRRELIHPGISRQAWMVP
jgi:hypothetical protein